MATLEWWLFPPSGKSVSIQQVVLALCLAVGVCVLGAWQALAAVFGIALLGLLILGPSRLMLSVFLVFIIATHQFMFPVVVPAGGVEWQVRELLLFALLAHWAFKALRGKLTIRHDALHWAFASFGLFFVLTALRGLVAGNNLSDVIGEFRNPLFLSSYFVFATLIRDRDDFDFYVKLVASVITAIAIGTLAFSAYATASGNILQLYQTPVGELMQKSIGPVAVQMFRPNGHELFEVAIVTLISLVACPALPRARRFAYALLLAVFGAAIAIGFMRTAYAVALVSLCCLIFLSIPSRTAQGVLASLAVVATLVFLGLFLGDLSGYLAQAALRLDLSLRARIVEIQGAWNAFTQHPLMGAGMGSRFEALGMIKFGRVLSFGEAEYLTIHNVWMYWLLKGGIVGLVLILTGLGGVFARAYLLIPEIRNPMDRYLARGLLASFVGQLIGAFAMPRFTYAKGFVLIAMFGAAFLVLGTTARDAAASPAPSQRDNGLE